MQPEPGISSACSNQDSLCVIGPDQREKYEVAQDMNGDAESPLLCVFDRPKTIALEWRKNGEVTEWNPIFAYATLEIGVGVELCWPYQARQKGSVENLVGFVKSSLFKAA
jgi:hypothetical protein